MGTLHRELDNTLEAYITAQPMFFIASAPINSDGLINISPRATQTLKILDSNTVAYLDISGGGIESITHIKENGRLVMMFCGEQGRILRLHGRARAVERYHAEWPALVSQCGHQEGLRAIIVLTVTRISDNANPLPSVQHSEPPARLVPQRAPRTVVSAEANRPALRRQQ
jgi:hypothetical protein